MKCASGKVISGPDTIRSGRYHGPNSPHGCDNHKLRECATSNRFIVSLAPNALSGIVRIAQRDKNSGTVGKSLELQEGQLSNEIDQFITTAVSGGAVEHLPLAAPFIVA